MKRATCTQGRLFDLAAGALPADEALFLSRHVATCASCAASLRHAEDVADAAAALARLRAVPPAVSDELRERLWTNLAPAAESAAAHAQTHAALRHLARSRYGALAAAAIVLLAFGAVGAIRVLHREPAAQVAQKARVQAEVAAPAAPPALAWIAPQQGTAVAAVAVVTSTPTAGVAEHAPRLSVLHLACGAAVHRAGADVRVARDEPGDGVVHLAAGTVQVEVPKLPPGARMAVETQEARVEVKGTRFAVTHAADGTTVRVTEGTVWVTPVGKGRAVEVLTAGQTTRVPNSDAYRSDLRGRLKAALAEQAWPEVAAWTRRLLETLDEGTEADGLRLQLAAIAARAGEETQAVALAEQVAVHGALDLTRQNALVFEANVHRARKHVSAETDVWVRYCQQYPSGAHRSQALERLVQLTCQQTSAEAAAFRAQLLSLSPQNGATSELVQHCEPEPR